MAKNFDKYNKGKIANIAKKSNEQANLITIKYYDNSDLIDYPDNNEDLSHTDDLEVSIKQLGFTDPIEITDTFNFKKKEDGNYIAKSNGGKFMIISGHRRRMAGINLGMDKFPCILRKFENPADIKNYVLMSNAQRNVDNDPLLYASRYSMHEKYLESIGFKGSKREEIAKRMGVTTAHADRYKQLNKVIIPIIDLIRSGKLGMSSVTDTGLYTHGKEEQKEILEIFKDVLKSEENLTREKVKKIIDGYRAGKRKWDEIQEKEFPHGEEIKSESNEIPHGEETEKFDTEPELSVREEKEKSPLRNDEVDYDFSHREEEKEEIEEFQPQEKHDKNRKNGEKISKYVGILEDMLSDYYDFNDEDAAVNIKNMGALASMLISEMSENAYKYDCMDTFEMIMGDIKKDLENIRI